MSDTDFKAVPMQLEEARYSYRNSQQISSQTGLIGYLRADMGTNGNEFWSTWNDYRKDLKTDDFKSEFDDVINSFREKGQFLSDRQTLSRFCDDSQNALEFGERYGAGRDYGVRVNTQDYAYLMRLNPHMGKQPQCRLCCALLRLGIKTDSYPKLSCSFNMDAIKRKQRVSVTGAR